MGSTVLFYRNTKLKVISTQILITGGEKARSQTKWHLVWEYEGEEESLLNKN